MHVHVTLKPTTAEIKPEHRSALIALAVHRGQKGSRPSLEEAIESYLAGERERSERREELLSLAGLLSGSEAEELRSQTRELRESWREYADRLQTTAISCFELLSGAQAGKRSDHLRRLSQPYRFFP